MKYYKSIFLLLIVPYFLFGGRKENINRSDIHDCKWNETGNIPGDFPVLPELSIANVRDVEGDVGQKSVEVMVVLSQVSSGPVTVAYSTKDGTASAAGSDYVSANGSVTFAKGEMMKRIVVSIIGDVVCEPDETFEIFLSDPSGVTLANNTGPEPKTVKPHSLSSPLGSRIALHISMSISRCRTPVYIISSSALTFSSHASNPLSTTLPFDRIGQFEGPSKNVVYPV